MELLAKPVTRVWLALVVITVVTTWVLTPEVVPAAVATVAIMVLIAGKIAMIMAYFMELRRAPWQWQAAFGVWVLAATGVVLGMYFGAT